MDEQYPNSQDEDPYQNFENVQNEMTKKEQENQYLRSRNFGLQDAAESGFMPKNDSNVIEYKLSSEELLERIEHYLKGDVLKTRVNEDKQVETYYAAPTKKISISLYKNEENGKTYLVNEHHETKTGEEWNVLSVIERNQDGTFSEYDIEMNYKPSILKDIQEGLNKDIEKEEIIEEEKITPKKGRWGKEIVKIISKVKKSQKKKITFVGFGTKEIPDLSRMNLSEYGVQEVMNILSMYINKETFLSWYKEERIFEIMGDIGDQLNKFFLINSKLLGLDTEYKKTKYPVIVVTILHTIENAYRRALLGSENKGTREGIIITQHQPMGGYGGGGMGMMPQRVPKKKWSPFDKSTW